MFTPISYIYVAHICMSLSKMQYVLHNRHYKDQEPSPESFQYWGLYVCSRAWHSEISQTPPIYSASYFNLGGAWSFIWGAKPPKAPSGDGTAKITK